jgi:hypothetical protein
MAMNTTRLILATILAAAAASGQALSVDPPSQVGTEIKRAEAAWNAWHAAANPKLERTILTNPNALDDIGRDEEGARRYLDARRRIFEKLSIALGAQIAALRRADPVLNTASAHAAERRTLAELVNLEDHVAGLRDTGPESARSAILEEGRGRQLKTIDELKQSVIRRIDTLDHLAGEDSAARRELDRLVSTLESMRRQFDQIAEATEAEKAEWQNYFAGLREIAVRSGVAAPTAGDGDDRPPVKKPKRSK